MSGRVKIGIGGRFTQEYATQQVEKAKNKTKAVKTDYEQLEEDYEILLGKCNSLLLENFELRQKVGC